MQRINIGQAIVLAILAVLLIGTGFLAMSTWNATADVEMSMHGWIALGLGTFFSLVVGCGLMALVFYSSRYGYDEAAEFFQAKVRTQEKARLEKI